MCVSLVTHSFVSVIGCCSSCFASLFHHPLKVMQINTQIPLRVDPKLSSSFPRRKTLGFTAKLVCCFEVHALGDTNDPMTTRLCSLFLFNCHWIHLIIRYNAIQNPSKLLKSKHHLSCPSLSCREEETLHLSYHRSKALVSPKLPVT